MPIKKAKETLSQKNIPSFKALDASYRVDEIEHYERLKAYIETKNLNTDIIKNRSANLIKDVRNTPKKSIAIENFLDEFGLTTPEGIALMCLAEALLRVPDADTANALIEDKITNADWKKHAKAADDMFLSLSSWALMMSGNVMDDDRTVMGASQKSTMGKIVKRLGEPVIRTAMLQAMKLLGQQFVMGQTIEKALKRAKDFEDKGFTYSYDMLGEGARTHEDAKRYFDIYAQAIEKIGIAAQTNNPEGNPQNRAGISVKLSAIHPRYEFAQRETCLPELTTLLKKLALRCKHYNIGLTVDAEETERLEISFELIAAVFNDPDLDGWEGFGLALQAYQKRAFDAVDWLAELSKKTGRKLMVRLVKGAYWDTEIKRSQVEGHANYSVFTRKAMTDLSYKACALKLLEHKDYFYPQLATHNAYTAATILATGGNASYEFQRLHGMGEPLYNLITTQENVPCRIYAPVGTHKDLLPYLVRRMLENGANSSFVNQIMDENISPESLSETPLEKLARYSQIPHPKIDAPVTMFGSERDNSAGYDLETKSTEETLKTALRKQTHKNHKAFAIINGKEIKKGTIKDIKNPSHDSQLGAMVLCDDAAIETAIETAEKGFIHWSRSEAQTRADALNIYTNLLEEQRDRFIALLTLEAGKTWKDGVDEVREAIDFCRYYAAQGVTKFGEPILLPGPTGEENWLSYHGRGVWACISPWNFPLAIFTGQIVAALMAGNSVLAKPAEQTSLIGYEAVKLMHQAGIPTDVLQLVLAKGSEFGAKTIPDERIKGFAFTGSTAVAKLIQRGIANRDGAIIPLIAETGGQNAMIVDNTALPEQVVDDVIKSSFHSAGQRCSALRVLFLQEEIAPTIITMLKNALKCQKIGDPADHATDIGPVIDVAAKQGLDDHILRMRKEATFIASLDLSKDMNNSHFVAPHIFELDNLEILTDEVFGPILHIIRYKGKELEKIIKAVNDTKFGLTLGIHSRIDFSVKDIAARINVGNSYVNRSMTGAVVGVQPFGGEGLSGTGPKAGGPTYLYRFATERTLSINTTASGGNASLISLGDDDGDAD